MAKYGYRRVSTLDQNLDRQDLPADIPKDNLFEEKRSAKTRKERTELATMIRCVSEGDEVYVWSIDRLARSLTDLMNIVDELVEKGVKVLFLKENLSFSINERDLTGKLMLQVLGAIAEFERSLTLQRQREGIEKAKAAGKYKGQPKSIDRDAIEKLLNSDMTPAQVAGLAKIGLASVYRIKKELAEDQGESKTL